MIDNKYYTRTHNKRTKLRRTYRNKALEELMCGKTELADGAEEW